MIFSSSRKDESTLWALIDIQSGMVRGSVVLFRNSGGKNGKNQAKDLAKNPPKKEILFTTIHPTHKKTNPDVGQISKVMLHNLNEVANLIAREGMQRARAAGYQGNFTGVHYILSSPWVISQTRTINMSYTRPTAITQATIQELVNTARSEINIGNASFEPVLIEQKIFDVKLNGYSVTEFVGKAADHLEVSFAFSVSSKSLMEKISSTVHKSFRAKKEFFHSSLLLEYAGIRDILHDYNEYMVIHVHSEITDVVVVKNSLCIFISSFPIGTATITRKLSKSLRMSDPMADSTLAMYVSNKLSELEHGRIQPVVADIGQGWLHNLTTALSQAGDNLVIPRTIILSSHSHYGFFESILKNSADLKPTIRPLEFPMIEDSVSYGLHENRSMRMGIYTIAISSFS